MNGVTFPIALLVSLFAVWAVVVRDVWRAWRPGRLLRLGRHTEARLAAERLRDGWAAVPGPEAAVDAIEELARASQRG